VEGKEGHGPVTATFRASSLSLTPIVMGKSSKSALPTAEQIQEWLQKPEDEESILERLLREKDEREELPHEPDGDGEPGTNGREFLPHAANTYTRRRHESAVRDGLTRS
jgi:hypothetical protein